MQALHMFYVTAKCGSVSKAAEVTGHAQPNISTKIQQLEASFLSLASIINCVAAGMGYSLLPLSAVETFADNELIKYMTYWKRTPPPRQCSSSGGTPATMTP